MSEKAIINENVEIWAKNERFNKCLCFITKVGINQNVGICLKTKESIRILKFKDKIGNQSKCWNLSANHQIVQNDVLWAKSGESIKKLTFVCNMVEIDHNFEIWVQNVKSIKMLKFGRKRGVRSNVDILLQKWKSIKLLEFDWKIRNWSEYWNFRTTLRIDQNVEIWVQNDQNVQIWVKGGINKTLKFEDFEVGNQSKCWNLSANGQIDQNVEIWVKRQ